MWGFKVVFVLSLGIRAALARCNGVVVKVANSQQRGCEFETCSFYNNNTICEEGNGKPAQKSTSQEETHSPVSGFCYGWNPVCDAVFFRYGFSSYKDTSVFDDWSQLEANLFSGWGELSVIPGSLRCGNMEKTEHEPGHCSKTMANQRP